MTTAASRVIESSSIDITEETRVRASVAATFEALLEEMGPSNQGYQGVSMPMTLEPWPGGRDDFIALRFEALGPVFPAKGRHPQTVDQNDGLCRFRHRFLLPQCG